MSDLVIVGAGAMGRELFLHAKECEGHGTEFQVAGFLDDDIHALDGFRGYPRILDTIDGYEVAGHDVFAVSISDIESRKRCVEVILKKGGRFISLIHPTVRVAPDASIGQGTVILRQADVGSNANIGRYAFVQNGAIVGHDVSIGDFTRIDCYVVLVGGVTIGDEACIHTAAIINRGVTVMDRARVGAASFVIRDVPAGATVFGNPARTL